MESGAVYDRFADALICMNASLESNLKADRRVRHGKVVEFRGIVSSFSHVPDWPLPPRPIPD